MSNKDNIRTPSQIINYYLKQIKEVNGTMWKLKKDWKNLDEENQFEPFDDGIQGCRMNLMGISLEWHFEGKNIIKKFARSDKRRIKKKVETALRKARKKYAN